MSPRAPVSATLPDWSRERPRGLWDPGRRLLGTIRRHQRLGPRGLGRVLRALTVLEHRFWSVVAQADIPLNCHIEGGLKMPHPNGIVVHPKARIGPNCLLMQQVTLGTVSGGAPVLEGHVDIGAGAKVLGPVRLGAHCVVGANAVVTRDMPEASIVAGIPAKVLRRKTEDEMEGCAP